MRLDHTKTFKHANERLTPAASLSRAERIDALREFLAIESNRLKTRHGAGLGGREIAACRCYQVDLVVQRACEWIAGDARDARKELRAAYAMVALGGYGRRELAPFSDVDILFLRPDSDSKTAREYVEGVLSLLWDAGLTIGHAYRSTDECIESARNDVHSRTALAEARLVFGGQETFTRLLRLLDERVFANPRETPSFLTKLQHEIAARRERFGGTVGLLEPNVKESAGGLRDLHCALWLAHTICRCRRLDDLRDRGYISAASHERVSHAYDFITRVRNQIHLTAGRKVDLLSQDSQPDVARALGYIGRARRSESETLMRDYYRHASELHRFCETFLLRTTRRRPRRLTLLRRRSRLGAFEASNGQLCFAAHETAFSGGPLGIMHAFDSAQEAGLTLAGDVKIGVRQGLDAVNAAFRGARETSVLFRSILSRAGRVGAALRLMHETGFLGRLLPEFGRLTFLPQHDLYHRYTVDEHTLKAVEALDAAALGREKTLLPYKKAFDELKSRNALYLGTLLHDVGKGRGGGHAARGARLAVKVCERLRIPKKDGEHVAFLVRHHLAMARLSQRRDLTEESLTAHFAATVGSLERLNMLLLLTYADLSAVAPGVFNEWKAALLWELYSHARTHLSGKSPILRDNDWRRIAKADIVRTLESEFPHSEIERHLALLPDRYLRATASERVSVHLRLTRRLAWTPVALEWRSLERRLTELMVATRDGQGVLARLTGALSLNDLDILSVDVATREDGVALDTFRLRELPQTPMLDERGRARIENDVRAAIEGRLDVAAAFAIWRRRRPPRRARRRALEPAVSFEGDASAHSTVIEVRAEDEPGLAYRIAGTLTALGFNINFAKIGYEKSHALEVFYVTDEEGRKLGRLQMRAAEEALLEALGAAPVSRGKHDERSDMRDPSAPAGGRERGAPGGGNRGHDGDRSEGLRTAEGAHRDLPRS